MMIVKMPGRVKPAFRGYIGIDCLSAQTPEARQRELRVYKAAQEIEPVEIAPPTDACKYWTRRVLANRHRREPLPNV